MPQFTERHLFNGHVGVGHHHSLKKCSIVDQRSREQKANTVGEILTAAQLSDDESASGTGLRAAWKSGRLHEHPLVIAAGGLLFAGLLAALLWRGAGRWQQYEVTDFSQIDARPLTAFAPGVDNVRRVFKFSVRIEGQLNGSADVSVYAGPPERLSGKVDWSYSQPHDNINTSIKITPVGDVTGRLVVHYRFLYH